MPIKIPNALPATETLQSENIFVITETRAITQDIRPLKIANLNLMSTKITTETQLARLLGNSPLQVELELLHTASHRARNTAPEHMLSFYRTYADVRDEKFDGLIITGAPVEKMAFEEVTYWEELCQIMEWSKTHVTSTLHICWGAQAGLYYHYGIRKYPLEKKLSGIFPHKKDRKTSILLRGFDDTFMVPHSRHAMVKREEIEAVPELKILASGVEDRIGVYAVSNHGGSRIFITGHPEYDGDTLKGEYLRDKAAGLEPALPENYFPQGDTDREPAVTWRSHANLLYSNWLNYFVYQTTPYDIKQIG